MEVHFLLFYLTSFIEFCKVAFFVLGYISNNSLFPEPLSPEEEKEYLERYMQGDEEARNVLIERNLRLVAHICKKYNIPNLELDDLISIGTIGLIKGINTFNTDKNVRLATYASRCIENEVLMYLRSTKKIGAEVYLNEPIGKDKDDNEISLIDILENDEKNIEDEIDFKLKMKQIYEKIKSVLKKREQIIIELRFGIGGKKPKTQNEVAKILGISRSYVSRIETKAIKKLNNELGEKI